VAGEKDKKRLNLLCLSPLKIERNVKIGHRPEREGEDDSK